ncbi:simple sugar transport system ATP-binding protein [Antricoccus suffuscus]|uniref:Simple sugar transport system ATP-binding protein n=1 Tax=Antricoccus suffuscus TaxID=1629062 RepID=A0A2T0ZFV8_9ACTN|nr:ABC transporter ATP-binding protein [Antricoccus suffuscus]PRZ35240.1 simple sugar transport system ATP-binding protein [Antricoccus suffuscus]
MTKQAESGLAVELIGITKRFPGVVANKDIFLKVRTGTVHAIVGENGAGKSTLMKTLYGMQRPDEGEILIDGQPVKFTTPLDAIKAGIGMVHQHFMLADNLTVLENIVLGAENLHGIGTAAKKKIREISSSYGMDLDPDSLVEELGVGDRQRVEIVKVLYRGAKIIILDEPTAVLVPQEVDELFDNLRELKSEGLTVIFISHKLDEVLSVADDVTVIRRGTTVAAVDPKVTTAKQLAELMVGNELPEPTTRGNTIQPDVVVLNIAGMTVNGAGGRPTVNDVSLKIRAGEILGIAGVEGNGQAELVEAIMGLRLLESGSIDFDGDNIVEWSTRRRREAGIGYIPEDRHRHGLLLDSPLWENRILGHQTQKPNIKGNFFIDVVDAKADTKRIVAEEDVRTPSIDVTAGSLSGGNQQKLIIGREMAHSPKLLIAAHPTRGVDVGAQSAIWDNLRSARAAGMAMLLISADLDELIGLSDTLLVILRGAIAGGFDPSTVTPEDLGGAMTGAGEKTSGAGEKK